MPFRCARGPFSHNEEPTLEQMLSNDIVQLMMARDRITAEAMRQLASEVRDRRDTPAVYRPGRKVRIARRIRGCAAFSAA
jgi:hypothetical protein